MSISSLIPDQGHLDPFITACGELPGNYWARLHSFNVEKQGMQILLDDLHTAMQMECRSELSFRVWSHFILQRHRGGLQGWTKVYSRYEERRFCLPWFWNVRRRDVYRFSVCDRPCRNLRAIS
jgi:hypothetical protein